MEHPLIKLAREYAAPVPYPTTSLVDQVERLIGYAGKKQLLIKVEIDKVAKLAKLRAQRDAIQRELDELDPPPPAEWSKGV